MVTLPDPEAVEDEASFLEFVRQFAEYRAATPSSDFWENVELGRYLKQAVSWAEASDFGRTQGLADANPWKRIAVFLYAGAIYE